MFPLLVVCFPMTFDAGFIVACISAVVAVISAFIARQAVTRSLRPVLVFVRDAHKVWFVNNVGTAPRWMFWLPRKTRTNTGGSASSGCRRYRRMDKSLCHRRRAFLASPTTTPRTSLIQRSAQDTGINFRRAMFLINPMRGRLLFTQTFL
jgi:hypothetical protein